MYFDDGKRNAGAGALKNTLEKTTVNVSCETYGFIREGLLRTVTMCV